MYLLSKSSTGVFTRQLITMNSETTRNKKNSDRASNMQETDTTNYRADHSDKDCGVIENNKCIIDVTESCLSINERENVSSEESNASLQGGNSPSIDDFLNMTPSMATKSTKRDNNRKNFYLCELCGKNFTTKSHLNTHTRTHTGEKTSICDICGKCFSNNSKMKLHKMTHTGQKPFQCEFCDKRYTRLDVLKIHIRKHTHPGEKPFRCDFCDKCYSKKCSLNDHIIKNHQVRMS